MFYPARMCKVRIIESKASLGKVISLLEKFGGAEIKRVSHEELHNEKAMESLQGLNETLVRIDAMLAALPAQNTIMRVTKEKAEAFLDSAECRRVGEKITQIQGNVERAKNEIEVLKEEERQARNFFPFSIDFSLLELQTIDVAAGIVQGSSAMQFTKALKNPGILKHAEKSAGKKGTLHLVAYQKGNETLLQELGKAGFERIPIPRISGTPAAHIAKAEEKIRKLESGIKGLENELSKISKEYYSRLSAAREFLKIEADKSAAPANFGSTGHTIIVEAYLPERNYNEFEEFTKKELNGNVYIRRFSSEQLAKHHEETPTLLEHSSMLAPFEFMTKFVSLPKSNEIDPTIIFLVFFPIFYALMVGDVIYGIISFLIARWLTKKFAPGGLMNPVAKIWKWSAIPTIIFGFIYDEYAGMTHGEIFEKLGLGNIQLYRGIERIPNVQFLLLICVMIGIVTMGLGFLLGFVNARKHGNNKHAIGKMGWFGVLCSGTVLLSTTLFKVLPAPYTLPSAGVFVLSLAAIVKAEGVMGVIELPSLLSNVLSFTRIIAVGLVGTVIASILNSMAYPSPEKGLLLVAIIPLYVFGHVFNAGMAMFDSFIQGARLNYVEFYSKFFEGGGREFAPFRFERKYLKD